MAQDAEPLSGHVEADETFVGGKPRESYRRMVAAKSWNMQTAYWDRKAVVFGAVERGGRIRAEVVPNSRAAVIQPKAREFILPGSMVYTDEYHGYDKLGKTGYKHRRIKHHAKVYVDGDVHTQTIEGFFGLFKNGIRGVYHSVSAKWLQTYINEYTWRYNHRDDDRAQYRTLLLNAARSS